MVQSLLGFVVARSLLLILGYRHPRTTTKRLTAVVPLRPVCRGAPSLPVFSKGIALAVEGGRLKCSSETTRHYQRYRPAWCASADAALSIVSFANFEWLSTVTSVVFSVVRFLYPFAVIVALVNYRMWRKWYFWIIWVISDLFLLATMLPGIRRDHFYRWQVGGTYIAATLFALILTVFLWRLIMAVSWGARTLKGEGRASSSTNWQTDLAARVPLGQISLDSRRAFAWGAEYVAWRVCRGGGPNE